MYNENAYFLDFHGCTRDDYPKLDKMKSISKVDDRIALLKLIPKNLKCAEMDVFKRGFPKLIYEDCEPKELHFVNIWEGRTWKR